MPVHDKRAKRNPPGSDRVNNSFDSAKFHYSTVVSLSTHLSFLCKHKLTIKGEIHTGRDQSNCYIIFGALITDLRKPWNTYIHQEMNAKMTGLEYVTHYNFNILQNSNKHCPESSATHLRFPLFANGIFTSMVFKENCVYK